MRQKKNSSILDGAAVYAVSLDSSLRRLQTEYDALMAAKRFNEAKGVDDAMRILRRMEVHVILSKDWRESVR